MFMHLHVTFTRLLSDLTCDRFKTKPITCFDNMRPAATTQTFYSTLKARIPGQKM